MIQHYIEFYSPGTFMSEVNRVECTKWDIEEAKKIATTIAQRHGARPFGFRFTLHAREDNELNSKQVAQSGLFYLGGKILTREDIESRNDPRDHILLKNMEYQGIKAVVENRNSYLFIGPLAEGDVVLEFEMPPYKEQNND